MNAAAETNTVALSGLSKTYTITNLEFFVIQLVSWSQISRSNTVQIQLFYSSVRFLKHKFILPDFRQSGNEPLVIGSLMQLFRFSQVNPDCIKILIATFPPEALLFGIFLILFKTSVTLTCLTETVFFEELLSYITVGALTSFHIDVFLKRFNIPSQCLVPPITNKVISYSLVLGQQLLTPHQIKNFH